MAQTKREIQALLAAAGIRPLKRFGQHFLIDGNLMGKLVSGAGVKRDDVVLEVGPGTGSLTEELLALAGHVVAVEIDRGLAAICRARFGQCDRATLIHGDILARKSALAREVLQTLEARRHRLGGRIMMVANLPYQVATPLLANLLMSDLPVSPLCFTVQAEVAERILAPPGDKTYGQVSVMAQALARIRRVARVPPEAFWPAPKVESTMLRVDVRQEDAPTPEIRRRLVALVQACFGHRRKTMKSNLRPLLDDGTFARIEADGRWDLGDRPEQITVSQWLDLARFLAVVLGGGRS